MVLFDNININQMVEVWHKGHIVRGKVKFKGVLNGKYGEYVGIALNEKVGDHDGMLHGRRYFFCTPGTGIFTVANQIRFISMKRCLFHNYRQVGQSEVEDELFGQTRAMAIDNGERESVVTEAMSERARSAWTTPRNKLESDTPLGFHLRHSVGHKIPAVTMLRPATSAARVHFSTTPIHVEYENDAQDFISSSSIPKIHMPYEALKKQVKRGWDRDHYTRYMSVHTGRDSIKYSQWNDIS